MSEKGQGQGNQAPSIGVATVLMAAEGPPEKGQPGVTGDPRVGAPITAGSPPDEVDQPDDGGPGEPPDAPAPPAGDEPTDVGSRPIGSGGGGGGSVASPTKRPPDLKGEMEYPDGGRVFWDKHSGVLEYTDPSGRKALMRSDGWIDSETRQPMPADFAPDIHFPEWWLKPKSTWTAGDWQMEAGWAQDQARHYADVPEFAEGYTRLYQEAVANSRRIQGIE